jgi:hypothetical protein
MRYHEGMLDEIIIEHKIKEVEGKICQDCRIEPKHRILPAAKLVVTDQHEIIKQERQNYK